MNPTPPPIPRNEEAEAIRILEELPSLVDQMHAEISKTIVGQRGAIDGLFYALLAQGHCLLIGMPGLAKTLIVRALSRVIQLDYRRVQFTPDLMPSDITGTEILQDEPGTGHHQFVFSKGPIFTQALLADEINRTPPKTQAALLEAMQEKTVTVAGKSYPLPEPFLVMATQNPIEQEGTYPLPEAQLDRFIFSVTVNYPGYEEECQIVAMHSFSPLEELVPVFTAEKIIKLRKAISQIPVAPHVVDYAVRLVRSTRPLDPMAPEFIRRWVKWGASPRASQNLILAGRVRAACLGRFHVAVEDIAALAPWVLSHRIMKSFQADADQKESDQIIKELLQAVPTELKKI